MPLKEDLLQKSEKDKKLSMKKYFEKIRPHLCNTTHDLRKSSYGKCI